MSWNTNYLFATLELKTEVVWEVIISVAQGREHRTRRQGAPVTYLFNVI